MLIFDIETRPLPIEQLQEVLPPFDPGSFGPPPGEFDPHSVKIGNLKDDAKIAAKIQAARDEHARRAASYQDDLANAERAYWQSAFEKAALTAETGAVAAIGYMSDQGKVLLSLDTEKPEVAILRDFWGYWTKCAQSQRRMVGFNSNKFDIPFIVRRSWYLGVQVPGNVFTPTGYVSQTSVDLLDRWQCGDRRNYASLDKICRAAGVGTKPEGVTGAMFHELLDDPKTRDEAIAYLKNDLAMTKALAKKLCVC